MNSESINERESAFGGETAGTAENETAAASEVPEVIEPEIVYEPEPVDIQAFESEEETVEESMAAEEGIEGGLEVEEVEPEVVYSPEPAEPEKRRSFKPLLAVILAVLLAAAGGAYWYFHSDGYQLGQMEKEAAEAFARGDYDFTDGKLVPVRTSTAPDGSLRYVVGVGREVEQTMTCREESLDYLYGSQPRYRSPI